MSNITVSARNTPQVTQGTVEPIKMTANTHGERNPNQHKSQGSPGSIPQAQATPEATQSPSVTEDPQLSAKFAALARKEKALRQRTVEMQAYEAEIKSLREEATKAKAYRDRLKSNPLDVLSEEGVSYDQLMQRAQATVDPNVRQVLELQAKVQGMEEALKRQSEESQSNSKLQREQAEKQITADVLSLISSAPEFETVKDMGAEDAVTQLIVRTFDEDGVLLTTDQAAKQVNEYLVAELKRISEVPSAKKLFNPTPAEPVAPPAATQPQKMTTLSNQMTGTSTPQFKTWAEKKADIIARYSKK